MIPFMAGLFIGGTLGALALALAAAAGRPSPVLRLVPDECPAENRME